MTLLTASLPPGSLSTRTGITLPVHATSPRNCGTGLPRWRRARYQSMPRVQLRLNFIDTHVAAAGPPLWSIVPEFIRAPSRSISPPASATSATNASGDCLSSSHGPILILTWKRLSQIVFPFSCQVDIKVGLFARTMNGDCSSSSHRPTLIFT